jgi:hypothetical protein
MALNKYQKQAAANYRSEAIGGRGGAVEIQGLKETQKALRGLSKATRDDMKEVHRRAGQIVVDGVQILVPVRTGALLASIKSAPLQRQGRVRIGSLSVPYAGPIHFGWPAQNIKPNPFIYDVLDSRREEVQRAYEGEIAHLIRKYDLDGANPGKPSTDKTITGYSFDFAFPDKPGVFK